MSANKTYDKRSRFVKSQGYYPKTKIFLFKFKFLYIHVPGWIFYPAGNYLFKVNNKSTRTRCEVCSKLIIKTPERRQASFWCLYC